MRSAGSRVCKCYANRIERKSWQRDRERERARERASERESGERDAPEDQTYIYMYRIPTLAYTHTKKNLPTMRRQMPARRA